MLFAALLLPLLGLVQPTPANTYAVLDIANEKGELTALSSYIGDELSLRLGSDSGASLVERGQLKKVLKEHNLQASGAIDESTIASMGKFLGATRIMTGQYYQMGDDYVAMVRVLDVTTGKVLRMSKVSFPKSTSTQALATTILEAPQTLPNQRTPSETIGIVSPKSGPLQINKCRKEGVLTFCHGVIFSSENGKLGISNDQPPYFLDNGNVVRFGDFEIAGSRANNNIEIPAGIKTNVRILIDDTKDAREFKTFKLKYSFAGRDYVIEGPRSIE